MKSILFLSVVCMFCQCTDNSSLQVEDISRKDSPMIVMPKADTPVSQHVEVTQENNSEADENMKTQLNQYQNALMSGDIDLAYSFFYPKAIEYLKTEYPNENIDDNYIKEKVLGLPMK